MRTTTVLLVLPACLAFAGCVERKMQITSEPAGALVYISDREVGRTPVTVPFTWYGDYEVLLRRDGYQMRQAHANILLPWYEVPPLDLLSDVAPWTYRDHRYLHYELEPLQAPDEDDLIRRADRLRERNLEPVKR